MAYINVCKKNNPEYSIVCDFASRIYRAKLNYDLRKFPEYFFYLMSKGEVQGCIGLNSRIQCPLFINDKRVLRLLKDNSAIDSWEQSVLATEGSHANVLLLISILLKYCYCASIKKIIFAGTQIPFKAANFFGFSILDLGRASKNALSICELPNFSLWFEKFDPKIGLVEVQKIPIDNEMFKMCYRKVKLGDNLRFLNSASSIMSSI